MQEISLKNFDVEIYNNFLDCKEKVITPIQTHSSNVIEIITGDENLNDCDALVTLNKEFKLNPPRCLVFRRRVDLRFRVFETIYWV